MEVATQHGLEHLNALGVWPVRKYGTGQAIPGPGMQYGKACHKECGQNEARCCRVEICAWRVVGVRGWRWGVAAGGVYPSAAEVQCGNEAWL